MDAAHSGKLEYDAFRRFGELIGFDDEKTELLFHTMDSNATGAIDVVDLFEWFQMRLLQMKSDEAPSLPTHDTHLTDTGTKSSETIHIDSVVFCSHP